MQRGQKRRPREHEQHIKTDDPLDGLEDHTEEPNAKHNTHHSSQQQGLCISKELPMVDLLNKRLHVSPNDLSEQVIEDEQILSNQG